MYTQNDLNENNKFVNRYVKPLIYNICPAFVEAELVTVVSKKKNCVVLTTEDGNNIFVDVTDMPKDKLAIEVLKEVGEFFNA